MTWIIWGNAKPKADCKEKAARVAIAGEMFNLEKKMVEAAGVEPASENVTGQETTCLFAFMPQSLGVATLPGTFAAHAQNGQETLAASL